MRKIVFGLTMAAAIAGISLNAYALMVTATSISSGVYEDGTFTPSSSGFSARYFIDENGGVVTLEEVIENNREGRIEQGTSYDITNVIVSEGLSALLVSKNKKGQKIITAVREGTLGASEIIMIGEDFYEYCKASNGKLYLEYGRVSREE